MLGRIREQLSKSSLVILDRLQFYAGILWLPLIDEILLENSLLQIDCLRCPLMIFTRSSYKLLAVLGLPVIILLVNWDDKPLVGALHIFDKFTL